MKWKTEEIEFLKNNYGRLRYGKIAKSLNRSLSSIYWKCHELRFIRGPWPRDLRWDKKKVIEKLKEATIILGHSPSVREVSISLRSACQRHFGSFNKAKEEAGLDVKDHLHILPSSAYRPSKELAYVLGALMGDGSFRIQKSKQRTSYVIIFGVSDKDFMDKFVSYFERWCCIKPKVSFEHGGIKKFPNGKYYRYKGLLLTQICSKEAIIFLKKFKDNPIRIIEFLPFKVWNWFLKGIWDAEGSISDSNGYPRLYFSNSNLEIINLFKILLMRHEIRFSSYLDKEDNSITIEILGFGIIRFLNLIKGITIKRKLTDSLKKGLVDLEEKYQGLDIKSDFYKEVYRSVRQIPSGRVSTYSSIANALNCKAYRAVGIALNKNPFSPDVPCHRVINSDGHLGGYAEGLEKKIILLRKEGIEIRNNKIDLKVYGFNF